MKHSLFKWGIAPLVACAFLGPSQLMGQAVKYQSTGWDLGPILYGVPSVNADGLPRVLGYAHIVKMEAADPRLSGRGTAWLNMETQADGTTTFEGMGYTEVGTWANSNFTPTQGVWDGKFNGVVKTDGSIEYRFSARGIGGSIDGLHVIMTATKASNNPADPYHFSGTMTGAAGK